MKFNININRYEKDNTLFNNPDTAAVVLFALRYSMGRMTYAPSLVIEWIKLHWKLFHINDKNNIKRDVKEFIDSERNKGMDCDKDTWNSFNNWLEKN